MRAGMKTFAITLLTMALASTACGPDRAAFQPTTNVSTSAIAGQPAASYDIRTQSGVVAHVKIWSRGAYRAKDGRTIVHLVADMENIGGQPVRIQSDQLRLEAYKPSGAPLPRLLLTGGRGLREPIPPGEARTVELDFATPASIEPDGIGALRLRWSLGFDDGRRYVQFTEFQRVPEPIYATGVFIYDPIAAFYDPFLYGPPYAYHYTYRVPVRRVIIGHRDHPQARRD